MDFDDGPDLHRLPWRPGMQECALSHNQSHSSALICSPYCLPPRPHTRAQLMAFGVPLAFFGGMAVMYARLHYAWRTALKFTNFGPGVKPRSIHTFLDDFDVEVAARIGRVFEEEGANWDPAALDIADNVLRAGVGLFPASPYLRIVYSNFLIEVCARGPRVLCSALGYALGSCRSPRTLAAGLSQLSAPPAMNAAPIFGVAAPQVRKNNASGWAQLELARKLEPNLSYQFSIFTREQEHKQKAAAGSSGEQVRVSAAPRPSHAEPCPAPPTAMTACVSGPPILEPKFTFLASFPQAVDLVSYVEFQKNYKSLLEYHKAALEVTRDFWRIVMRDTVPVRGVGG